MCVCVCVYFTIPYRCVCVCVCEILYCALGAFELGENEVLPVFITQEMRALHHSISDVFNAALVSVRLPVYKTRRLVLKPASRGACG